MVVVVVGSGCEWFGCEAERCGVDRLVEELNGCLFVCRCTGLQQYMVGFIMAG